jgi:hypothetical protein
MSNIDKSDSNYEDNATTTGIIVFQVTENIKNIGIKDFILNGYDFEITLISDRKCCVIFSPKKTSISEYVKSREKITARY